MIKPFDKKIYIKINRATKTTSGVALPENKDFVDEVAEVLAVGEQVKKVKKGDKVLFKYWALDTIIIEDEKHDFIDEENVIGLFRK